MDDVAKNNSKYNADGSRSKKRLRTRSSSSDRQKHQYCNEDKEESKCGDIIHLTSDSQDKNIEDDNDIKTGRDERSSRKEKAQAEEVTKDKPVPFTKSQRYKETFEKKQQSIIEQLKKLTGNKYRMLFIDQELCDKKDAEILDLIDFETVSLKEEFVKAKEENMEVENLDIMSKKEDNAKVIHLDIKGDDFKNSEQVDDFKFDISMYFSVKNSETPVTDQHDENIAITDEDVMDVDNENEEDLNNSAEDMLVHKQFLDFNQVDFNVLNNYYGSHLDRVRDINEAKSKEFEDENLQKEREENGVFEADKEYVQEADKEYVQEADKEYVQEADKEFVQEADKEKDVLPEISKEDYIQKTIKEKIKEGKKIAVEKIVQDDQDAGQIKIQPSKSKDLILEKEIASPPALQKQTESAASNNCFRESVLSAFKSNHSSILNEPQLECDPSGFQMLVSNYEDFSSFEYQSMEPHENKDPIFEELFSEILTSYPEEDLRDCMHPEFPMPDKNPEESRSDNTLGFVFFKIPPRQFSEISSNFLRLPARREKNRVARVYNSSTSEDTSQSTEETATDDYSIYSSDTSELESNTTEFSLEPEHSTEVYSSDASELESDFKAFSLEPENSSQIHSSNTSELENDIIEFSLQSQHSSKDPIPIIRRHHNQPETSKPFKKYKLRPENQKKHSIFLQHKKMMSSKYKGKDASKSTGSTPKMNSISHLVKKGSHLYHGKELMEPSELVSKVEISSEFKIALTYDEKGSKVYVYLPQEINMEYNWNLEKIMDTFFYEEFFDSKQDKELVELEIFYHGMMEDPEKRNSFFLFLSEQQTSSKAPRTADNRKFLATVGKNTLLPFKLKLNARMHLEKFTKTIIGLSYDEACRKIMQSYEYGYLYEKLQDYLIATEDYKFADLPEPFDIMKEKFIFNAVPDLKDVVENGPQSKINNLTKPKCNLVKAHRMTLYEKEATYLLAATKGFRKFSFGIALKQLSYIKSSSFYASFVDSAETWCDENDYVN